jgi:hypothetical protein
MSGRKRVELPLKELARRYLAGYSLQEAADEYGVTARTVRARLVAAGVQIRPSSRSGAPRPPQDVIDELAEEYRAGCSLSELADNSGIPAGRLRGYLLEAGVELRTAVTTTAHRRIWRQR